MKKRSILIFCTISIASQAIAQNTQKLKLEKATVFLNGAQLESSTRVSFAKGENEVRFVNVAGDIKKESIVINAGKDVVVESITPQNNYLVTDNVSPKVKELKDSMESVARQKETLANKNAVLDEQLAILQANRKSNGNNVSLSVVELQKLLEIVATRMDNYLAEKNKNLALITKLDERYQKFNAQLQEEQSKDYQPGGVLLVKFYAKDAATNNVHIMYNVANAGWSPTYDIWAEDSRGPLKFFYKALLHQNTGIKWEQVHLTISTGNPVEGMSLPELDPMYLSFESKGVYITDGVQVQGASRIANFKQDEGDYVAQSPGIYANNSSMNRYVTVDSRGVSTSFDVELPYTIPTDGQTHLVAIKRYEVPASYHYVATPKADNDAFLQADITNWEDLNLLAGPTNIFIDGTYVGQGSINMENVRDTLSLSLGRDKKVVVKRELDKKRRSVKTIGTNIRESFAYNITVRNTRKEAVSITVQDQQPISNDKDIVLEDQEMDNADYNESTGLMKWNIALKPNESRTIRFGYTVKYPRGKRLNNW